MFGMIIFFVFVVTVDLSAMDLRTSSSSSSISSGSSSLDSSSYISPRGSMPIGKNSKSKKDNYQEQEKKKLLALMKANNTADVLYCLQPDVNIADEEGKTPLIIAIQNRNEDIINALLLRKNTDLNQADKLGNTPLHHAVFKQNDRLIQILLYNPYVNSLFKNKNNYFAHQFIDDQSPEKLVTLKSLFFVRARLDSVVDKRISDLRGNLKNTTLLGEAIAAIKNEIAQDADKQGDEALPEKIQLPTDVEFIKKVIFSRVVKNITSQETEIRNNVLALNISTKK